MRKEREIKGRGEASLAHVKPYMTLTLSGMTPLLRLVISNVSEERVKSFWLDSSVSACAYGLGGSRDKFLSHLDLLLGKSLHNFKSSIAMGKL